MEEIWKDIKGYEGCYQISNLGRVKSLARVQHKWNKDFISKERMLRGNINTNGYPYVVLRKNGEYGVFRIHRLVAEAFIPNPNNFPQVNHKDEDKTNNRVDNLEWCDGKYNCCYGTRGDRIRKKLEKPVAQYSKSGILLQVYQSQRQAARAIGVPPNGISLCVCGKIQAYKGFIWKNK